jgi:O-antigen/teichoic acid export membrane protein
MSGIIVKALTNKVLYYVFSRYATYFIQFVNSLFIAVYLGPYYLGVWGFIRLVIEYLNQINLGIAHSVNAIIAINKKHEWYVKKVIGTSLTMLIILSLLMVLFFCVNKILDLNIGSKYSFIVIGILAYFNTLFSNIFRVYGRVIEIAINQSVFPVFMLIAILLFKRENLLWALVGANVFAFFVSFVMFLLRAPISFRPLLIVRLIKTIQVKGWYLFIYNTSFYLIIITTKSFISAYYSVEEFGYFTFAYSLANVVLLLLQSFSFLIFPKLINRMASTSTEKIANLLGSIRNVYITTSHLLVHLAIVLIPFFVLFFPQYDEATNVFRLTALTIVLYSNAFGYSGLLIAKRKEKYLARLAMFALGFNVCIVWILASLVHLSFSFVIFGTMLANFIYIFLLGFLGRKILFMNSGIVSVLKDVFSLRLFMPYLLNIGLIISGAQNYWFIGTLLFFILLNFKILKDVKDTIKRVIVNPGFINV